MLDPTDWTYPFGTHAAVVEVDMETGEVQVIRYVAVDDCGNVVNPTIVEGQVHGGVAQGIGQALFEEVAVLTRGAARDGIVPELRDPVGDGDPELRTGPDRHRLPRSTRSVRRVWERRARSEHLRRS